MQQFDLNPKILYFVTKYCGADWGLDNRTLPFHDLTFITAGTMTRRTENGSVDFHSGEVSYTPIGASRIAGTSGMECYAFNFLIEKTDADILPLPRKLNFRASSSIPAYLKEFHQVWMSDDEWKTLKLKAVFLQILHELLRLSEHPCSNPHIQETKAFIIDHLTEDLSVGHIAEELGLSPVYLGSLFKRHEQQTISQFVNEMRVRRAEQLLRYENCNVSEAALQSGFGDVYYFSRVFHRLRGMPPSQCRNS